MKYFLRTNIIKDNIWHFTNVNKVSNFQYIGEKAILIQDTSLSQQTMNFPDITIITLSVWQLLQQILICSAYYFYIFESKNWVPPGN